MSRPLKKSLFGNTKGYAGDTNTQIGGTGITSISILTVGVFSPSWVLSVRIDAPTTPGGRTATATATYVSGVSPYIQIIVTDPGEGYFVVPSVQLWASANGNPATQLSDWYLSTNLGVAVPTLRITANVGGVSDNRADIVRQISTNQYLVRNSAGIYRAYTSKTGQYYYGACPNTKMFFYCTDNNSARYTVGKISAHRLTLWQDPTSSGWLFASGTSVPWVTAQSIRTNANVTLDTVY